MNRRDLVLAGLALTAVGTDIASAQTNTTDENTGLSGTKLDLAPDKRKPVKHEVFEVQNFDATVGSPGLAAGETPLARDEEAWRPILERLATLYSLPSSLKGEFASTFLNIANGLSFEVTPSDPRASSGSFRYWHVEPLLEQAADLLDRAVRDRAEWDDKAVRSFALALELAEFQQLDKVHEDEIKAGFYTLPYKQSQGELGAERALKAGHSNSCFYLKNLLNDHYSWEPEYRHESFAQLSGWLSGTTTYSQDVHGAELPHTWTDKNGKKTQTRPLFLRDCAAEQSRQSLGVDRGSFYSHYEIEQGLEHASDARQQSIAQKASWDKADIDFRRRRTEIARGLAELKLKAATDQDGVLNYPVRMLTIRDRFQRDVRDALSRLHAASQGMELLYGYKSELKTPKDSTSFDEILIWARDAISWINGFSQLEQNYVLSISLKESLPKSDWERGVKQGKLVFVLKPELFASQAHVRLRGVSACVEGCGPHHVPWHLVLQPPAASSCHHLSGTWIKLDQSDVPPCQLGRALGRVHSQEPDVVGMASLHNVSPIGTWGLSFLELQSKKRKPDDVVLDFHLAFRNMPG